MTNDSIEIYLELLKSCGDIQEFTKNTKVFSSPHSSQFCFHELNRDCFDKIYKKNDKIIPKQEFFGKITNLKETCANCWKFYMSPRNKSVRGLDIQLGKRFQEKFLNFLNSKGILCKTGDRTNKIYPDNLVVDENAEPKAYLEIKYQSAPWLWAYKENETTRECYEASPALDVKKMKQQHDLLDSGQITVPIYYVFWLDFPCIKGVFFMSLEDMWTFYTSEAKVFQRKVRDGDFSVNKTGKRLAAEIRKIHPSIYQMGSFNELIRKLS